jgi:4-carboxymuconolactone decarboxylase
MSPDSTGAPGPWVTPAAPHGNPEEIQPVLDALGRAAGGTPQNIFLTLARNPKLLRDYLPFGSRLLLRGTLPARDRELAILRTAWLCGCEYEWGHHVRFAADAGLSEEEIAGVANPQAVAWSEHDDAILRATGELVRDHAIAAPTWNTLAQAYDDAALVEFTMLVGHYAMLAGMLNSARVPHDEGTASFPEGQ